MSEAQLHAGKRVVIIVQASLRWA